jgi:hypothetical protein
MAQAYSKRKTPINSALRRPDARPGAHNASRPAHYNGAPWKLHAEKVWREKLDHDRVKPGPDVTGKFFKTPQAGTPAAEKREARVMGAA